MLAFSQKKGREKTKTKAVLKAKCDQYWFDLFNRLIVKKINLMFFTLQNFFISVKKVSKTFHM